MAMSAVLFVLPSEASARHDCDEGHYRILEPNVSADPPTSCLGLEVVGEMEGCEHAQLRIDNQCDSFVKTLDDSQAYCELVGSGQSECQVIGSGVVGYLDLPWRKVVDTEQRKEHRYDVQVEGRTTFLFVSFDSERVDSPEGDDGEEMMDEDEDRGCSTAAARTPSSALSYLLLVALGLVGLRVRNHSIQS
jgi:hypothetical protein